MAFDENLPVRVSVQRKMTVPKGSSSWLNIARPRSTPFYGTDTLMLARISFARLWLGRGLHCNSPTLGRILIGLRKIFDALHHPPALRQQSLASMPLTRMETRLAHASWHLRISFSSEMRTWWIIRAPARLVLVERFGTGHLRSHRS
jgi:hypothetical protein